MHFKEGDVDEEFTVIPDHGFVDRVLAKELVKPGMRRKKNSNWKAGKSMKSKSGNKKLSGTKRSRSKQGTERTSRSRTKRLKTARSEMKDDEEVSLEVKSNSYSPSRDDSRNPYGVPPCKTLEQQIEFVDKMKRCGRYLLFMDMLGEK